MPSADQFANGVCSRVQHIGWEMQQEVHKPSANKWVTKVQIGVFVASVVVVDVPDVEESKMVAAK
jgi:hypothetical protein